MGKILKRLDGLQIETGDAPVIRHRKTGQIRGRYSPLKLKRRKSSGRRRRRR